MKPDKVKTGERTAINWDEVHQHLQGVAKALEQGFVPGREEMRNILRTRARALAQEPPEEETAGEQLEILEFLLAGERYGAESSYIREVYPLRELVPIPGTPSFVLGITSVRGRILSVIDIRKFFDLPEKGLSELDKIIIVQSGNIEMGIRADTVLGMRSIGAYELQTTLPTLTGIRERYLKGITKEQMAILGMEKLIRDAGTATPEKTEGGYGNEKTGT